MTSYSNHNMHKRTRVAKNYRPDDGLRVNQNNGINSKRYHDTSSNITFQQSIPPPISTNMHLINSPSSSIRRLHSSCDSDDDYRQVMNKKKKYKQKQATSYYSQRSVNNVNVDTVPINSNS